MKQKRGRPRNLPAQSPHWIPYLTAMRDAADRFRSDELAVKKLNAAFAAGEIQCKLENPDGTTELLSRNVRVTVQYFPPEMRDEDEEPLVIRLNDRLRAGWIFLWEFDLNNFFGISPEPVQPVTVKKQQTRAAVGHPVVHDWREITLIIVRLHRDFRKLSCNALVGKVQEHLAETSITAPAESELQKAVKQVMGFEERHAQRLKQFSETQ